MLLQEIIQDPEFLALEAEINEAFKVADVAIQKIREKFPVNGTRTWGFCKSGENYKVRVFGLTEND